MTNRDHEKGGYQMTIHADTRTIDGLVAAIQERPDACQTLQSQLHRKLKDIRAAGGPLPNRYVALERQLNDDAIESRFDNMPV